VRLHGYLIQFKNFIIPWFKKLSNKIILLISLSTLGIGVAIPSVIAYNYFLRRIKLLITDIENFSEDLVRLASREINK